MPMNCLRILLYTCSRSQALAGYIHIHISHVYYFLIAFFSLKDVLWFLLPLALILPKKKHRFYLFTLNWNKPIIILVLYAKHYSLMLMIEFPIHSIFIKFLSLLCLPIGRWLLLLWLCFQLYSFENMKYCKVKFSMVNCLTI